MTGGTATLRKKKSARQTFQVSTFLRCYRTSSIDREQRRQVLAFVSRSQAPKAERVNSILIKTGSVKIRFGLAEMCPGLCVT